MITSDGHRCALVDVKAEDGGIDIGAQRVDIVHHEMLQLRPFGQQLGQHAVAQQVGDFVPVADRVQALLRQVVGVVAAFAHASRPADQRSVQAVEHLLRLLVEQLLRHFFPGKAQVARHGDQAQADDPAGRQVAAGRDSRSCWRTARVSAIGLVGQVAGGDDVRHGRAGQTAHAAALGQVDLDEAAVFAAELDERIERFDDAGPLVQRLPAPAGQRDDGHLAIRERLQAEIVQARRAARQWRP